MTKLTKSGLHENSKLLCCTQYHLRREKTSPEGKKIYAMTSEIYNLEFYTYIYQNIHLFNSKIKKNHLIEKMGKELHRHVFTEDIQMINKHMQRRSTSSH